MMRILLTALILMMAPVLHAGEQRPCSIMMKFGHDKFGPVALYNLTLQTTNRTGRDVSAVSALFFNGDGQLLGNTELSCIGSNGPLGAGSTGECSKLMQTIDGKMMEKFGTETWTAVVNTQLDQLNSIRQCEVIGFRYSEKRKGDKITNSGN